MYAQLDSLLDYSRVGRTELATAPTDLDAVLAEVTGPMRPWLDKHGAIIEVLSPLPVVMCERHGGRLWMESTPGDGSAFYFTYAPGSGSSLPAGAASVDRGTTMARVS